MQSVTVWCGQPDPFFIRQNLGTLFRIGVGGDLQPTPAVSGNPLDDATGVRQILSETPERTTYAERRGKCWLLLILALVAFS
jgi:hypothetical protein